MTDQELLEKAAKAARIAGHYKEAEGVFAGGIFYNDDLDCLRCWNPLEDDGDALRLAAKLYLWEPIRLAHRDVTDGVDIYAATRRAIVRAAAAIADAAGAA